MEFEPRAGVRPSLLLACGVTGVTGVVASVVAALTGLGAVPEWLGSLLTLVVAMLTWVVVGEVSGNRPVWTSLAVAPGAMFLFVSAIVPQERGWASGVRYAIAGAVLAGLAVVVLAWLHRRFGTRPESEDGGDDVAG